MVPTSFDSASHAPYKPSPAVLESPQREDDASSPSLDAPQEVCETSPKVQNIFELPEEGVDLKSLVWDLENALIDQALERSNGKRAQAARLLGLKRTTLVERLKKRDK